MLRRVTIKNFRSCRETVVDFSAPLCALIGKNGAGKTNFLQAIRWLAQNATRTEPLQINELVSPTVPFEFRLSLSLDGKEAEYEMEFQQTTGGASATETLREVLREDEQVIFSRENERVNILGRESPISIGKQTPVLGALPAILPEADAVRRRILSLKTFLTGVSYYGSEDTSIQQIAFLADNDYEVWQKRYEAAGELPANPLFRLLHMQRNKSPQLQEFQQLLGEGGLGLVRYDKSEQIALPDSPNSKINFFFFEPLSGLGGAGKKFLYFQLSTGTRRIIYMLSALLFDKRSVMLVEEPDDSVHPGLVEKILAIWRKITPSSNLIFTSHSPYLLNQLQPDEIRLVDIEDGRTVVRGLTSHERKHAISYLEHDGTMADFISTLEEQR